VYGPHWAIKSNRSCGVPVHLKAIGQTRKEYHVQ